MFMKTWSIESKDSLGLGVFVYMLVGVRGFEPRTSRTRTVRSTGLSHTPNEQRADYTIVIYFGK